jgi:hypothetical protein
VELKLFKAQAFAVLVEPLHQLALSVNHLPMEPHLSRQDHPQHLGDLRQ